jgi:hypothetical protein
MPIKNAFEVLIKIFNSDRSQCVKDAANLDAIIGVRIAAILGGAAMGHGGEFDSPLQTHFGPVFSSLCRSKRLSSLGEAPSATSSAVTFTTHATPGQCNCTWRSSLSSGSRRQGAREHLARHPSSGGSASCHRRRTVPVALRRQFATSLSWLHEPHTQ